MNVYIFLSNITKHEMANLKILVQTVDIILSKYFSRYEFILINYLSFQSFIGSTSQETVLKNPSYKIIVGVGSNPSSS